MPQPYQTFKFGNEEVDVATDNNGLASNNIIARRPINNTPAATTPPPADPLAGRSLPTGPVGDFKSFFDNANKLLTPQSSPTPTSYNTPAMIEEAKRAAEAKRATINSQFDTLDTNARELGAKEVGGAGNKVGRLRDTGFSSAAEAYIADVQTRSEKRLNDLRTQRQQALASLDTALAGEIQGLMLKEMERQDKLADTQFQRMATVLGLGLQFQGLQDARSKPVEVNGILYEKQTDGTYKPVAGSAGRQTKELGDQLWEQQDDGSWKMVADGTQTKRSASYLEYQDYVADQQANGQKALTFNEYLNMDANRKAVRSNSTTNVYGPTDVKAEREVQKSTVAAGIQKLAKTVNPKTGKLWNWGDISQAIIDQGFDPKEFDDVFHRTFTSQGEYEAWAKAQKK